MRPPKLLPSFLALCLGILFPFAMQAQNSRVVRVAAAADLQPVMLIFAQEFEKETGIKLVVSLGSSGTLATQIVNGAPFDVFLGADFTFPEKVVAAGKAEAAPVAYAKGTLVLWARKDLGIAPLHVELLTDPRIKTVAIANAEHAPYGRAAVAALEKLKIYDAVKPKLVVAENVAQTGQFVESGNAQVGLISLTLASSEHYRQVGQFVLMPFVYPEIRQCAVVVKGSDHAADAKLFLDWVLSDKVQGRLKDFGISPVK
ncbi:molybdate transport system substrate-binding protein [Granulicella rosea]|uniref:Molybdate transport system substrate-binding protein n=1 Tax=Granulicella rosea TaxID=474952 RepID=A0A239H7U1_9BACT|nr:molybdate ABC transporter substrate-binding protein [Granulicella rosea]SNS77241.1 molybdate transport system substrate-binding protein [Granulicella rosea]